MFQSIIDSMTGNIEPGELVRLSLDNPQLEIPSVLPFMTKSALERLLSEIERVLQSYEQFVLDETLGIEVVHEHMPVGSGKKNNPFVDIQRLFKNKRSILQINNTDDRCCAWAIVTAIARVEKDAQWENTRKGFHIQMLMAIQLHELAIVPLTKCGMDGVKQFQADLPSYQIHVLSKEHFNAIVYCGPEGGIPIYYAAMTITLMPLQQ